MNQKTMSNSNLLFDTNAAIALINGDQQIIRKFPQVFGAAISVVVLAELLYGAEKSTRRAQNLAMVESFANTLRIIPCGYGTARICASVRNLLRLAGKPVPANDLWIAASAIEHRMALVTRDRHFKQIDGLQVVDW
ncbi:MAG TPA: type II toxin-antitoxin system VapC family toxin [Tepidisphaeraceae bacterium]|nr:type II toxin-antitoxin system VapC family toxin [Tepidisphaeraceae bacterium]